MKHVARKRFGQNFLVDRGIIEKIVAAIAPRPGETMLEIGPGLGALTAVLIPALAPGALHAVELDRDLAARLRQRYGAELLVLHEADALSFEVARIGAAPGRLRVVGNLPYNISSPLLFHLAQVSELIQDQHFMLQREVVERMVAPPGTPAFGRLSVMLQVRYHMELLFLVPGTAFEPAPKVESAVVRMIPRHAGEVGIIDSELFANLVAQAFSMRRKMLRNTLAAYAARLPLIEVGIDATARAEDLAPTDYVRYANRLAQLDS